MQPNFFLFIYTMNTKILLITPPYTQLNTPYPATAYLKGFLNTQNIISRQSDLGMETILKIFCKENIKKIFEQGNQKNTNLSLNAQRILALQNKYLQTIEPVIDFLQNKNPNIAYLILNEEYLPEASRFEQLEETESLFGTMGIHDKARYLATLYLEDLSDFIIETIEPDFGFSRYAEHLGLSANTFDLLQARLNQPLAFTEEIMIELLDEKIKDFSPTLIGMSIPFPGNLLGALRCGEWIKKHYSQIKIVFGGGFVNTELRDLTDTKIFDYTDFITLDDGEMPILQIIKHVEGKIEKNELVRTFVLENGKIFFCNSKKTDIKQSEIGTPDYSDFELKKFLSVIEIANPMHRLWNDGRWNKLTFAHGCYWAQCSFCDTTLDYIKRYEPNTVQILCDRVEKIIAQTGENGFHFVDEAAPPSLMRAFALEVLKRQLNIVWWTNVRFERNFTADLCQLLKHSGCVAVSGGLEVASDRILKLINKGVDIEQVAKVTENFTRAGIMVHAYLMYGFPSQTAQETIDSLDVVRQLFKAGIVQSAYWHKFTMTKHSAIGQNPSQFGVIALKNENSPFANNDLPHTDPNGCNHDLYSEGLRKALFNYMHGIGFDVPIHVWFDFQTPVSQIPNRRIEKALKNQSTENETNKRIVWLGNQPVLRFYTKLKKGKPTEMAELVIHNTKEDIVLNINQKNALFIKNLLEKTSVFLNEKITFQNLKELFEQDDLGEFEMFWEGIAMTRLKEGGLLQL